MNVLLVYPKSPRNLSIGPETSTLRLASKKAYAPPLGLITVAALLPEDWNTKLVDLTFQEITDADWDWCEAVFTTGTLPQYVQLVEIIGASKKRGKIVAIGGAAAFHFPERFLAAGADFVALGEGEITVPVLVEKIEGKEFGSVIPSDRRADLAQSPAPRFDLLDMRAYLDMAIQFSRGCPFHCEFCDATLIFGRQVRTKSPSQVLQELQTLYEMGWRREIYVVDDNFIGNPAKTKLLLHDLIEWMNDRGRPFEFFTHASVNLANSDELMDLMVQAGFTTVYLGIESTDKEVLRAARKVQNAAADLDEACVRINQAGLQILAGTMIGMDGEQPGRDKSLIEFVTRNNLPLIEIAQVYAYPGTDLWRRLKKEDRLLYTETDDLFQCQNLTMNFVPTRPVEDIQTEFLNIMAVLYESSGFLDRAFNHFQAMRPVNLPFDLRKPEWGEIRVFVVTLIRWGLIRKTRKKFWRLFFKAYRQFDLRRFAGFVRSCVVFEHYVDLREEFAAMLNEKTIQR